MAEHDGGMRGEGAPRDLEAQLKPLREGVEGLFAHLDEIGNPPDYSADLQAIERAISAMSDRVRAIEGSPAFSSTPEDYARQINAAAEEIAALSGEEFAKAEKALGNAATVLERTISHQEQRRLLGKFCLFLAALMAVGAVAGTAVGGNFG